MSPRRGLRLADIEGRLIAVVPHEFVTLPLGSSRPALTQLRCDVAILSGDRGHMAVTFGEPAETHLVPYRHRDVFLASTNVLAHCRVAIERGHPAAVGRVYAHTDPSTGRMSYLFQRATVPETANAFAWLASNP